LHTFKQAGITTFEIIMWAAPGHSLGMKMLWTDTPQAMQHLSTLSEAGTINEQERSDLTHFIEHGWLVWQAAIEPERIDKFVADIRNHHKHPGKFLTTNHLNRRSGLKLSGSQPDRFESLFDLYVNLVSAREVCLHRRISRFLTLVFEEKPVISQQLLFQRSNGHGVHQDTSVVAVEDPLLLVASWIALEDVVEGSGELGFYDKSHRLPHYLFQDGTKRMNFALDDRNLYIAELEAACRRERKTYHRFLAKKGDVFFWNADLVHRSHPRTLPDDTSRLSCVTHYHPATTTPFWFRFHPDRTHITDIDNRGAYVSHHYTLPKKQAAMLTPTSPSIG
jgi:phytanoyl-CoA hydroxylase